MEGAATKPTRSLMIYDYSKYEMDHKEIIVFYAAGFCCIAFTVFLFYHSIVLSLLSGVLIRFLRPFYEEYMVRKRMQELNVQFKDMLYCVSASIASGRQMQEALIETEENMSVMYPEDSPIMTELGHMRKCILENNESDRALLEDFARRTKSEDVNNFVQVYATCRNMGGDLEKIIARASGILTDKMNIEREIKALTAQKKLEGRMIALMPIAMLLCLNLVSKTYIAPLYTTFMGRLIMTGCLAATVFGVWLMEKISEIEL